MPARWLWRAKGVNVTISAASRRSKRRRREIRNASSVAVTAIVADIATETVVEAALAACSNPDILVNNAGGPPPGDFRDWQREHWIAALDVTCWHPSS